MASALFIILAGVALIISSAYSFFKWGWKALLFFVPVVALFLIFGDPARDLPAFMSPLIFGSVGGMVFRKKWQMKIFLIVASFSIAAISAGHYYYLLEYKKVDLLVESKQEAEKLLSMYKPAQDQKPLVLADLDRLIEHGRGIMVFSSFMYGLLFSAVAYMVLKSFFSRYTDIGAIGGLELFKLSDYFIFALIAGWAVFLLIDKNEYYVLNQAGFNVALIFSSLYFIQALGVLKFKMIKKEISPRWLPFAIIVLMMAGIEAAVITAIMLTGLGALDVWADFRKLDPGAEKVE